MRRDFIYRYLMRFVLGFVVLAAFASHLSAYTCKYHCHCKCWGGSPGQWSFEANRTAPWEGNTCNQICHEDCKENGYNANSSTQTPIPMPNPGNCTCSYVNKMNSNLETTCVKAASEDDCMSYCDSLGLELASPYHQFTRPYTPSTCPKNPSGC